MNVVEESLGRRERRVVERLRARHPWAGLLHDSKLKASSGSTRPCKSRGISRTDSCFVREISALRCHAVVVLMLRGLAVFPTSTPATTSTTPGEAIPLQARPFHSFFSEHAPDLLRGAYSHASRSIFAGSDVTSISWKDWGGRYLFFLRFSPCVRFFLFVFPHVISAVL